MKQKRLVFLDGMRGFAALVVALIHFQSTIHDYAQDWIWAILDTVLSYGHLGVDVFFVISGFVIPLSIRNAEHTPGFLLRFALRRAIRLDPPLWAAIVVELLGLKLGLMLFPELGSIFPSVGRILAHLIYAQELLGMNSIVGVFWTLCHEVQFYLLFVSGLVAARSLGLRLGDRTGVRIIGGLGIASFLWSVAVFFTPMETPLHGLFIDRWFQFLLGYLAMRCWLSNRITWSFILASGLIFIGSMFNSEAVAAHGFATLVPSWLLVVAGQRDKLTVWFSGRVIQFLGRISYSLYLIHWVVGWRTIRLLHELNGADFTPVQAWLVFFAALGVSLLSAWIMYRFIETPSLRMCREIRMDRPLTMKDFRQSLKALW